MSFPWYNCFFCINDNAYDNNYHRKYIYPHTKSSFNQNIKQYRYNIADLDEDDIFVINLLYKKKFSLKIIAKKIHKNIGLVQTYINLKYANIEIVEQSKTTSLLKKSLSLFDTFDIPWWSSAADQKQLISVLSSLLNNMAKDLVHVMFAYCKVIPDILQLYPIIGAQQEINFASTEIDDNFIYALGYLIAHNYAVTKLVLTSNKINSKGAKGIEEALKKNTILTSLDIRDNSNIGMEVCKSMGKLIAESHTIIKFGTIPVQEIKNNQNNLTLLLFHKRKFCDTEAFVIGLLLKQNTIVTKLRLSHNLITDIGASAIADGLKINETLISLDLNNNKIHDCGARLIADALRVNKTVTSLWIVKNLYTQRGKKVLQCSLTNHPSCKYIHF